MTLATFYSAIYRQVETGVQITILSSERPLPVSPVGEMIEISEGPARISGVVARYFTSITASTSPSGHTNRTFVHQYEVAKHPPASAESEQRIAAAIANYATSKDQAAPATIWSERVTVRDPVGTRIAMRAGLTQAWKPGQATDGAVLLGAMSPLPPSVMNEPYLAIDFEALAGRNYVLAVESANSEGEAQIYFQDLTNTTSFGDLRVQRTATTVIGISTEVMPEQAGLATAYLGWHGFEDEIVAATILELQF